MFAVTANRVEENTTAAVNRKIHERIESSIARYAHASPADIRRRLRQLDREWDIERCLETMAPTLSLVGIVLGFTKRNRRWFLLPALVQSFFLQHALQGWCPPIPILRRLGVRTFNEIQAERDALEALYVKAKRSPRKSEK
jgi:hypothetical protein